MKTFLTVATLFFCVGIIDANGVLAQQKDLKKRWIQVVDGMEEHRLALKSGSYLAKGRMVAFNEKLKVDDTVKMAGFFDAKRRRLDRDFPVWNAIEEDPKSSRAIHSHIFTPTFSAFYRNIMGEDGGVTKLDVVSPKKRKHQYFGGHFDIQSLGLYSSYSSLRFGRMFDGQIRFFRKNRLGPHAIETNENGVTVFKTFFPFNPPDIDCELQNELWIDESRGFTPARHDRKVYEFEHQCPDGRYLYSQFTTVLTWTELAGVWVPETYRLVQERYRPDGEIRKSFKLDLEFEWKSVNTPLDKEVFEHENLDERLPVKSDF